MAEVFLALGSNIGDRRGQLQAAVRALAQNGVRILRASSLYETEPMYELDQPKFLNAVVQAETELMPEALVATVKRVERSLGRQPRQANGPREIDIDILLYEGQTRSTENLTIPHPRMAERPFVQAPLRELRGEPATLVPMEGPEWASL